MKKSQKSQQQSSFLQNLIGKQQSSSKSNKLQKQQNQFKALFMKNLILQSKQKCTNICQILTPVICLIFTYMIKTIAEENLKFAQPYDDNFYPYKFNDFSVFDKVNGPSRNKLQYFLYECVQECDEEFVGSNQDRVIRTGILGNVSETAVDVEFFPDIYKNPDEFKFQNSPFFKKANNTINSDLLNRLTVIGKGDFQKVKKGRGLDYLPDGSIKFTEANNDSLSVQLKIDDSRDLDNHRSNGLTKIIQLKYNSAQNKTFLLPQLIPAYGLLHLIHMTTASYIKTITEQIISAGFIFMPAVEQSSIVNTLINSVSALIFPLGLSLLFPVFLYTIVLEKEERLVQMMKMNGLKIRYYWLTFFMFNLMLSVITNIIFFLLGALWLGNAFFEETSKLLFFLVAFGWSLAQIGMAAFFQTFLNKSRSANIIGYLISIWTTMIGATLNLGVYQYPSHFPLGLQMFPPFAFVRLFYLMMMECSNGDCYYDIANISEEMKNCIAFLYIGFVVFFLLGAYLFEIIPQQFGVRRSPLFPFQSLTNIFRKKIKVQLNTQQDEQLLKYISQHQEDDFSKQQRSKVICFNSSQDQEQIKDLNPLIINNMRKLYKKQGVQGMYAAVRSFNLAIGKNQTFGLLGPNGAGKTTLISMITGMYEPNNGNAWIGGYDIRSNLSKAQLQMGVCPQFDLVWPQLSVSQHLYFYARLKGIPDKDIKQRVQSSIKQVKLEKFADFSANQLSGGMKRRLSVAISLVGDPKIVFLDEPSTGLDPENRRQLWAVLAECQTKRALFITTHMMEQADTLCNRIGIITNGVLRTIQTPIKLKKVYGQGYDVIINTIKEQRQLISQQSLNLRIQQEHQFEQNQKIRASIGSFIQNQHTKSIQLNQMSLKIVDFMKKEFQGTFLFKHFNGYLIFKVPSTFKISVLFQTMKQVEKQLGFSDIAITNSSLQDVFMSVVQKFDIDQKNFFPKTQQQILQQEAQQQEQTQQNILKSQYQNKKLSIQKKPQIFESVISKNRQSVLSEHQTPININASNKKLSENDSISKSENNRNKNKNSIKKRSEEHYQQDQNNSFDEKDKRSGKKLKKSQNSSENDSDYF